MKTIITLKGIKAEGKHGANPGEQNNPQNFVIDVYVELEVAGDELEATLDYSILVDKVKNHVKENSYKLIETMAQKIAEHIAENDKVLNAKVKVHKPLAAKSLEIFDVIAEASAGN